ncbi:MAG: alpha-N-acetylglucosaminidase N-terminal domain-containing protein, partial [Gemmatimonadaceae bacterium]
MIFIKPRICRLVYVCVALAFTVAFTVALPTGARAQTSHPVDLAAARSLIARVAPTNAAGFDVAAIPDSAGRDVFEVANVGSRVMLRGSSGVAVA